MFFSKSCIDTFPYFFKVIVIQGLKSCLVVAFRREDYYSNEDFPWDVAMLLVFFFNINRMRMGGFSRWILSGPAIL